MQYMICLAALATTLIPSLARAQTSGGIIPQTLARRYGLERAWFTQVELDRSRSRVIYITQDEDSLFVQTDAGILHVLDANTGSTRWSAQVGNPRFPSLAPAANKNYVAVINGSTLYVLNRDNGHIKWTHKLGGGPGAGPALSAEHVFVPLINGRVEAYHLEKPNSPPWVYSSAGRAMIQPIATERSVAWPTDRGYLFVAQTGLEPGIRFRVETQGAITSMASFNKPYIYFASHDGNVYAVHEISGYQRWRFSAGDPVAEPATVINDRVFVPTDHAGMYCLDAETGRELWWAPRMERFLAASKQRVYATDNLYQLYILDAKTGGRLAALPIHGMNMLVVNNNTDRIYLASDTGLIQCLHDASLAKPIFHNRPTGDAPEETADEKDDKAQPDQPDDEADPFGAGGDKPEAEEKEMDADGADPFGAAPADDNADADDPFGQ